MKSSHNSHHVDDWIPCNYKKIIKVSTKDCTNGMLLLIEFFLCEKETISTDVETFVWKYVTKWNEIYLLEPTSQNIEPSTKAQNVVKSNLTALYCGDLQYTRNCFLRHSLNCDMISWENVVSKCSGSDPGGGVLVRLMWASTSLEFMRNEYETKLLIMRT